MEERPLPQKLQQAAILQIVSGVLNVFVMTGVVAITLSTVAGGAGSFCGSILLDVGCPLGCFGMFGWACGLWGLALLPIGVLEIVVGAITLAQPETGRTFVRAAAIAEIASVLFGGVLSTVAGVVVMSLLRDPEVAGFLDG